MKNSKQRATQLYRRMGEWILQGNNRMKLFFFFFSAFLWLLIKLSKPDYTAELSFPLQYINPPAQRILSEAPPDEIKLFLRGSGFSLSRYAYFSNRRLTVDLAELRPTGVAGRYFWVPPKFEWSGADALGEELKVLATRPDTLYFQYQDLVRKKLPVKARIALALEDPTLRLYGTPRIEPDSVWVSGPEVIMDTLAYWPTKTWLLRSPADSLRSDWALAEVAEGQLRLEREEVAASLRFSKLVEAEVELPIRVVGLADSLEVQLYPERAKLRYRALLADFPQIRPYEMELIADFSVLKQYPQTQFISLRLSGRAPEIQQVSFEPKRIEFLLTEDL